MLVESTSEAGAALDDCARPVAGPDIDPKVVEQTWGGRAHDAARDLQPVAQVGPASDPGIDLQIIVEHPDEPPFTIRHFTGDALVSIDGTPEQNARTASWLRSILPTDTDVYAVDGSGSQHVRLHDGITAEDITSGWAQGLPSAR